MARLRSFLAAALLSLGVASGPLAATCPARLTIGFNDGDFPPMLYGQGTEFAQPDPGWLVRLAQRALAETGCSATWVRRPTRRLEAELETGAVSVAMMFGATDERLQRLAFPLDARGRPDDRLALVISQLSLYTLPGREADLGWTGRRVAAGKRIGVVRGTAQDQIAQALGLPLEPISGFQASVGMLRAGRFHALLLNPETVPLDPAARSLVPVQPPVHRLAYFAAASPALRRTAPAFLDDYWHALCRTMRTEPLAPRSGCGAPN